MFIFHLSISVSGVPSGSVYLQALLTGLMATLPYDPWEFISEKLEYLQSEEGRATPLQWY